MMRLLIRISKKYTCIPWYLYSEGRKGVLLVPLGKVDVLKGRIQEIFVDVGAGSGEGGRRPGGGTLLLLRAALAAGSTSYYRVPQIIYIYLFFQIWRKFRKSLFVIIELFGLLFKSYK
jgi:hypothetical protein